jgi:hypothetical protein
MQACLNLIDRTLAVDVNDAFPLRHSALCHEEQRRMLSLHIMPAI